MTKDASEVCSEFLFCFGYPLDGLSADIKHVVDEDPRRLQYVVVSLGA